MGSYTLPYYLPRYISINLRSFVASRRHVLWLVTHSFYPYHWGHYNDIMISAMASQITSLTIVHSIVYSFIHACIKENIKSSAWPVNSPHERPGTRKFFPFDDVIMVISVPLGQSYDWWRNPDEYLRLHQVQILINIIITEIKLRQSLPCA